MRGLYCDSLLFQNLNMPLLLETTRRLATETLQISFSRHVCPFKTPQDPNTNREDERGGTRVRRLLREKQHGIPIRTESRREKNTKIVGAGSPPVAAGQAALAHTSRSTHNQPRCRRCGGGSVALALALALALSLSRAHRSLSVVLPRMLGVRALSVKSEGTWETAETKASPCFEPES